MPRETRIGASGVTRHERPIGAGANPKVDGNRSTTSVNSGSTRTEKRIPRSRHANRCGKTSCHTDAEHATWVASEGEEMATRETESSLQQFAEVLLTAQLVRAKAAPYLVRWVRCFLTRPALDEPLADQVRRFREELERSANARTGRCGRQNRPSASTSSTSSSEPTGIAGHAATVHELGQTTLLSALEQLRLRMRTRHYSYRTEGTYVDWARRSSTALPVARVYFTPRIERDAVRHFPTHFAVRQRVSAGSNCPWSASEEGNCRSLGRCGLRKAS